MPSFGPRYLRNMRPWARASKVVATSARIRWMPALSSMVGNCAYAATAAARTHKPASLARKVFKPGLLGQKKRQGIEPCLVVRLGELLLHLVLLGVLLGILLRRLLAAFLAFVALLHFVLLLHRLGASVRCRKRKAARQGEHRRDQDGDQLPHVFPLREVKDQVVTSPWLRNQSLPVTPLSFWRLTNATLFY